MPMLDLPRRDFRGPRAPCVIACALFAASASVTLLRAAEHTLMPSPQTVHIGYFLATIKPVLSIDSGDIVNLTSVAPIVPSVVDQSGWSRPARCRNITATSTAR
jgi:hypothetical protein